MPKSVKPAVRAAMVAVVEPSGKGGGGGSGGGLVDRLREPDDARKSGLLTEAEHSDAKAQVIASFTGSSVVSSQPVGINLSGTKVHPKEATVNGGMILVEKGSVNQLVFDKAAQLKAGRPASLTLASHPSKSVGRMYSHEKRFGEWRYTESSLVDKGAAVRVALEGSGFLKLQDADLVLDVSFWKFNSGTAVNFVGGNAGRTRLEGGGRSWAVNDDGTISGKHHPHLVLGTHPPIGEWSASYPRISTGEIAGKWTCCCIPGGWACFEKVAQSEDQLEHHGCVCLFFGIPCLFGGEIRRRKPNTNKFYKVGEEGNVDSYLSPGCVCNGISCSVRLC